MNWEDKCYLLSKRKFRENGNIINIFTENKGKIDGIVYGGNSRKIRNYLQISNKLFVVHSSKNENILVRPSERSFGLTLHCERRLTQSIEDNDIPLC